MRLPDFAVGEQVAQQRGRALLPRVRTGVMDACVERVGRAAHSLETHGGRSVGAAPQRPGIGHEQRRKTRLRLRSVHEGQSFLGLERDRARHFDVPLADHRQGEMRQRRKVTGGTHAALRRHGGMELAVQHLDQQLGKDGSHPTRAAYEHVRPQHHHRPHRRFR